MVNLENITEECAKCAGIEVKECYKENTEFGFCDIYVQACNDLFHKQADLKTEELMKYHKALGLAYERKYK